ncbi:MAG: hypothetical protein ABIF71_07865 [Planctomycetota bacterium]
MERTRRFCGLIAAACLIASAVTAQNYYQGPMRSSPGLMSANALDINVFSTRPKDIKEIDPDLQSMIYGATYTMLFGEWRERNASRIELGCWTGDSTIGGLEERLDYLGTVGGSWWFQEDMGVTGAARFGSLDLGTDTGRLGSYALGLAYAPRDMAGDMGITLEYGTVPGAAGEIEFYGAELTALKDADLNWVKCSVGRFDDEGFVRTDVQLNAQMERGPESYAILGRYVFMNSKQPSIGAPGAASYGTLIGDWTKHEEWWVYLAFGIDRTETPWMVMLGYGYYRTEAFDGANDTILMSLNINFRF